MKYKPSILVYAIFAFSVLIISPAGGTDLSKLSKLNPAKIINIEKARRCPLVKPFLSRDFQQRAESLVRVPIVYIENSPIGDCYREQPLLFGFLTLFITVTLAVLGFVFHLIRNDPRFQ